MAPKSDQMQFFVTFIIASFYGHHDVLTSGQRSKLMSLNVTVMSLNTTDSASNKLQSKAAQQASVQLTKNKITLYLSTR